RGYEISRPTMGAPSSRSRLVAGEVCAAVGLAFEPHFKAVVEKEPSRLNALAGAAQATDHLGEKTLSGSSQRSQALPTPLGLTLWRPATSGLGIRWVRRGYS